MWCRHISGALISNVLSQKSIRPYCSHRCGRLNSFRWIPEHLLLLIAKFCFGKEREKHMGRDSWASTISYIFLMFFHVVSKDSFLRRHSWFDLIAVSHAAVVCILMLLGLHVFSPCKRFWGYNNQKEYCLDLNTYNLARGKLMYYVNKCSQDSIQFCHHSYPIYIVFLVNNLPDTRVGQYSRDVQGQPNHTGEGRDGSWQCPASSRGWKAGVWERL